MADRLMTFQQVAAFYAVTPRTVRNWAEKGAIPVVRTPGGQPRVPATAISTTAQDSDGRV
jgi:excisionase family DNA binding protein